MKRFVHALALVCLLSLGCAAQCTGTGHVSPALDIACSWTAKQTFSAGLSIGSSAQLVSMTRAGNTTTKNKLVIIDGSGNCAQPTTQGSKIVGIEDATTGSSGSCSIAMYGTHPCVFDNAAAFGDYVQANLSDGSCHDAGSSQPNNGNDIVGLALASGGAGTYNIFVSPGFGNPAGGVGGAVVIAPAATQSLTQPVNTDFNQNTSGTGVIGLNGEVLTLGPDPCVNPRNKKLATPAVGNGVADDTTAFQNIINSFGTTGGIICVPKGEYNITTLTITKPLKIYGLTGVNGEWGTAQSSEGVHFNATGSDFAFKIGTADVLTQAGVDFENFSIVDKSSGHTALGCIWDRNTNHSTFRRLGCWDFSKAGAIGICFDGTYSSGAGHDTVAACDTTSAGNFDASYNKMTQVNFRNVDTAVAFKQGSADMDSGHLVFNVMGVRTTAGFGGHLRIHEGVSIEPNAGVVTTGDTHTSTTIDNISSSDTAKMKVGMSITGSGVQDNTTVASISSTSITISQATTATAAGVTLTVGPIGVQLNGTAAADVYGHFEATTNGDGATLVEVNSNRTKIGGSFNKGSVGIRLTSGVEFTKYDTTNMLSMTSKVVDNSGQTDNECSGANCASGGNEMKALQLRSLKTTNLLISSTAPTVSSGFGTSPSVVTNNGTAAFTVNVGTGGTATSGVVSLPTATTGWNCFVNNLTAAAAHRADNTRQTASSVSSATLENQTTSTGAAVAWTASDILRVSCFAY